VGGVVIVLMMLNFVLLAALGVVLIQRFRSTRNAGYLVLGVPLVLWSLVLWPFNVLFQRQIEHHLAGESMLWPFSLLSGMRVGEMAAVVMYSQRLIELAFLIVGFVWLGREDARVRAAPPNSALQPTPGELRSPRSG